MTGAAPAPRPHRPARYADVTPLIDAAGGVQAGSPAELAAATAAALLERGRAQPASGADVDEGRFVRLAEHVGLDTLSELWRDADPVSLPGAMFSLYLLRQWCHERSEEVVDLWRAGAPYAPADAVVAGVAEAADPAALRDVSDAVLRGIYRGDLDVALERAAALFRVLAAGREELADPRDDRAGRELAVRNRRAATDLASAAQRWRKGTLQ